MMIKWQVTKMIMDLCISSLVTEEKSSLIILIANYVRTTMSEIYWIQEGV